MLNWLRWNKRKASTIFKEIPLGLGGRLFVSPMPFGPYDPNNELLALYKKHRVQRAVVLVTEDEITAKCGKDLFRVYEESGIQYWHFPVADLTAPTKGSMRKTVVEVVKSLQTERVVVHCNAGVGRTGVMTSCIVREINAWDGDDAMRLVKEHMHTDMTAEQKRFVELFEGPPEKSENNL